MRRLAEDSTAQTQDCLPGEVGNDFLEAKKDSKSWRRILIVWISFEVGVGVAFNRFSHEADLSLILWRVGGPSLVLTLDTVPLGEA